MNRYRINKRRKLLLLQSSYLRTIGTYMMFDSMSNPRRFVVVSVPEEQDEVAIESQEAAGDISPTEYCRKRRRKENAEIQATQKNLKSNANT